MSLSIPFQICRFIEAVTATVNRSDKLGYIYWFAVLVTITCGGVTGIFMTLKNKHDMTIVCQQKHELYETYWSTVNDAENLSFALSTSTDAKWNNNEIFNRSSDSSSDGTNAKHKNIDGVVGINELVARVKHFDQMSE